MSEIQYTPEQQKALDTRDVGVALDAGAGCGKTFVLTERYLSHLDPRWESEPANLDQIIAITFTDAAAREMRDRIRKKCRDRLIGAVGEEASYWRGILETIDVARVSTIHSLCASLIRQYAVELGIDPSFRVLDPAEATILRNQTLDETLSRNLLLTSGEPDPELVQVAAELSIRNLKEALRLLAIQDSQPGFTDWQNRTTDEVLQAWRNFYQLKVLPEYISAFRSKYEFRLLEELVETATPVSPGFAEIVSQLRQAFKEIQDEQTAVASFETLRNILPRLGTRRPDAISYKDSDFPDNEIKKQFTAAKNALSKVLDSQRHLCSKDEMLPMAELGLYLQRLAMQASKDYRKRKLSEGVLDNDDLLKETQRLLVSNEFKAEQARIAAGIRVLMVDEFQDTNQLQVDIVRALVESVSTDNLHDQGETEGGLADGRLFFVGDYKQSIYRFRQAEPEVFRRLQTSTPVSGRLPLSTNFRSQPAIIEFVNALFSRIFGKDYRPLSASKQQVVPSPSVEFLWTPLPASSSSSTKLQKSTRLRAESRVIARRIRELIDQANPIVSNESGTEARAAKPGDFVLLFRAHSDVAFYEEALREANLEYYVVGGKAFYAQQETYDLFNVLSAVESSCDDIALIGAMRSPFFGLIDETLFWLTRKGNLSQQLFSSEVPSEISPEQKTATQRAAKIIQHLRKIKNEVSISELIAKLIEETKYDATLLVEFLGNRKLANLDKLIEQARICDASGGDLKTFLIQLKEFINQPPTEGDAATNASDANVVRLMTIHSSKGLEFPIVILPDLERKPGAIPPVAAYHPLLGPVIKPGRERDKKDKRAFGIDLYNAVERIEERRERERLLYVACTRAADRLIFSSAFEEEKLTKKNFNQDSMLATIAKHYDLENGKPLRSIDLENDQLVQITETPAEISKTKVEQKSKLTTVLEKAASAIGRGESVPALVAPVKTNPLDLHTFSISRLNGEIQRDQMENHYSQSTIDLGVHSLELGTLIHAVLERIDLSMPIDSQIISSQKWVRSLVPHHVCRNRETATQIATKILNGFLASEHWAWFTQARQLRREVEFLMPWSLSDDKKPDSLLRGYIDAVVQDDAGAWHIADYKTNQVSESDVESLA